MRGQSRTIVPIVRELPTTPKQLGSHARQERGEAPIARKFSHLLGEGGYLNPSRQRIKLP